MARTICPRCGQECEVLFRWSYIHPETGQRVRAYNRPFPIPVCQCAVNRKA